MSPLSFSASKPVPDSEGTVSVLEEEGIGFDDERLVGGERDGSGMDDDRRVEVRGARGWDADADVVDAMVVLVEMVRWCPRTPTPEGAVGLMGERGYLWISSGCIRPVRPMAFNYVLFVSSSTF